VQRPEKKVKIIPKNIYLSASNLAPFPFDVAQGGESIEPRFGERISESENFDFRNILSGTL
jgi:hypothetical protein